VEDKTIKIAFSGFNGCGKDYCADYLQDNFDYRVFSFSDQHKNIAHQLFPWLEFDYPPSEKEIVVFTNPETGEEFTPRKIWETLDILPQIDPAINVEPLDVQIGKYMSLFGSGQRTDGKILIKDVRRPSELDYVKKNGYVLVYIECPNNLDVKFEKDFTERSPGKFQTLIHNESHFKIYNDMRTDRALRELKEIVDGLSV
jgi:hypothetical protein